MSLPNRFEKYTYEDYLGWSDDKRWELIDGTPYMQAVPSPRHQEVLTELLKEFAVYLSGKPCKVYPAPFCVRLPNKEQSSNTNNVVEPDISIICDKSKIDDRGCNGAPDLVIEIISPSSVKMDRVLKFNKYEKAGVKEYWIVEPEQNLVSVFVLQNNNRYNRPEMYSDTDKIKVGLFPELEIGLKNIF